MDEQNNNVNTKSFVKITMQETSSEESARESSNYFEDWSDRSSSPEDSTLNMCMSPPKSRTKRSNSRKKALHRNISKKVGKNLENRNPSLIQTTEVKNDQNLSQISDFIIIQDPISTLNSTNEIAEFNTKNDHENWSTHVSNSETACVKNKTVKKSSELKNQITYRIKKTSNNENDSLDRAESISKISLLLKLALRPRTQNKDIKLANFTTNVPPSTPSSSLNTTNNFSLAFKSNFSNQTSLNKQYSTISNYTTTSTSSSYQSNANRFGSEIDLNRQQEKNNLADNVWKEIYDFFEFYNDRAAVDRTDQQASDRAELQTLDRPDHVDIIDKRLAEARLSIPITVKEIMSTNFHTITTKMNNEIKEKLKTPLSYLNLYEGKEYMDQLCYIYWLVEEMINRVSYIETLYPSTKQMQKNEPSYADPEFEAVNKTLLLWYRIMTELMSKSDKLGQVLGFEKREENKPYWNWFYQNLSYSRKEYDSVHRWLKQNFISKQNGGGLSSRSSSRSLLSSPVIELTKPIFPIANSSSTSKVVFKHNRQISYELRALKKHLLGYENSSQSIISEAIDKNDSRRGSNIYLSVDTNSSKNKKLSPNSVSPEILLADFLTKTNIEYPHLEPAKLHHVNSFLSFNSLLSTESENGPLNAKFYAALIQDKLNQISDSPQPRVDFNLNDSPLETDPLPNESQNETSFANKISRQASIAELSDSALKRQNILKEFLHKRLRKNSLTKMLDEIREIILNTLPQALQTLQNDYCEYYNSNLTIGDSSNYHLMPLHKFETLILNLENLGKRIRDLTKKKNKIIEKIPKYLEYMDMFPMDEETLLYGVRSQWFQKLNLPSFRPIFLYLNTIVLELMHVCIKMQIEGKRDMKKQSNFKFSLLSIEVLTLELRECIDQAIVVRQFYYNMVHSVFEKSEMDSQQHLDNDLVAFDDDLKLIIELYLNFVTDWVHDLVACSDTLKAIGVLQAEWHFCKNNLYFVTASEDIYAIRFCILCQTVISSLGDSLHDLDSRHKQPLLEYIAELELIQEMNSIEFDDEGQMNSLVPTHEEILNEAKETKTEDESSFVDNGEETPEESFDEEDEEEAGGDEMIDHNRYIHLDPGAYDINLKCNEFKEEVNQIRKRCMKALGFCSNLINDLSLAAKYTVKSKIQQLLNELKLTNHVLVIFSNPEFKFSQNMTSNSTDQKEPTDLSFMIFVPQEFSKDKIQIARLLFLISSKDDYEANDKRTDISSSLNKTSSNNEKLNKSCKINNRNQFRRLSSSNSFLEMNEDTNSTLNKLSRLASMTNTDAEPQSNQNKTAFSNTYILSPQIITEGYLLYLQIPNIINETWKWTGKIVNIFAALPVKRSLYQHRNLDTNQSKKPAFLTLVVPKSKILVEKKIIVEEQLKSTISLIKEKTSFHPNIENAIDEVKESILSLRTESANSIRLIEKDLETHYDTPISISRKSPIIYQRYLSEIWRVSYNFGIDLQNECIKFMTQDLAKKFSIGIAEFCIMWSEYIVDKTDRGKGTTVQPWASRKGIQLLQEAFNYSKNLTDTEYMRFKTAVEKCITHVIGGRPRHLDSHQSDNLGGKKFIINLNKNLPPSKRFAQCCQIGDEKREHSLQDKRYIGKTHKSEKEHNIITSTEVNFRWQLGLKIGEGQYGTVYSCVNLDTGEPMAMKEIPFKSNDIEAIKNIYSEINNLQGVQHQNLVKLYGSELHRKEMLIFMEFCGDQCTLEKIGKETSGLPEKIVRVYTKSLLEAVATLHENNIMHRDIKGSNIFLKAIDPKHPEKILLKLGDFGCSIKFKDVIGTSPARATGFMGTFPFMAPEVMASGGAVNSTYSYSADIWSLGCVVIEMFTGKRPWHPLSDENITFKVHIQKPPVLKPPYPAPNSISDEAINFLDACLEFEPTLRLTADDLLNHPFVKVHEPSTEPSNEYFSL